MELDDEIFVQYDGPLEEDAWTGYYTLREVLIDPIFETNEFCYEIVSCYTKKRINGFEIHLT